MKYREFLKKLVQNNLCEKNQEVYIIASINNKGYHIGSIDDISLDIDGSVIIESTIDKKAIVG